MDPEKAIKFGDSLLIWTNVSNKTINKNKHVVNLTS